ncbi:MAG TPA: DUF3459 domain-containing protein, partial [Thermomicrobiaceae bacterium]|nr:DUF3459 domain-containing protein [Thermomicrobiaceae bacterium]
RNVVAEREEPGSILSLNRRLIALRRAEPALALGRYVPVLSEGGLLAYRREHEGTGFLVALNLRGTAAVLGPGREIFHGHVEVSTMLDRAGERVDSPLRLRPNEGVVIRLDG